jgi:hypothetical protein
VRFEDYARKMYPQYNCLNVPTWIIGPALGEGLLIDRPADVLKVWPTREPIQRLPPAQFSPLLDQLAEEKTRNGQYSVNGILSDIPSSGIFRVLGGDLAPSLRFIEENSEY